MSIYVIKDRSDREGISAEQIFHVLMEQGYQRIHRDLVDRMREGGELRLNHGAVGLYGAYLREHDGTEWTYVPLWVVDGLLARGVLEQRGRYLRLAD